MSGNLLTLAKYSSNMVDVRNRVAESVGDQEQQRLFVQENPQKPRLEDSKESCRLQEPQLMPSSE